jgi:hypothetical protein
MAAQHYEVIYGNQLADDLHNLFPDLIYSPTRFSNVQDVLQYMQTSMRNRVDLFSMARSFHTPVQTYASSRASAAATAVPSNANANANANANNPTPIRTSSTAAAPSVANPSTPQTRSIPLNPPIINSSRVYRQTASNMNPISLLSAFEIAHD